ncbi:hypothetical protein D3C77_671080 [compost metagenome]
MRIEVLQVGQCIGILIEGMNNETLLKQVTAISTCTATNVNCRASGSPVALFNSLPQVCIYRDFLSGEVVVGLA